MTGTAAGTGRDQTYHVELNRHAGLNDFKKRRGDCAPRQLGGGKSCEITLPLRQGFRQDARFYVLEFK
jgi:hypothetical protein